MISENITTKIVPNILIVDDNPSNIFAMKNLLEDLKINMYEASSGNEALQLLTQHEFALVLLDVQMPEIDGFETAELMRKNKHTKDIPIIFVTALSREEQYIRKGLQVGAVDYLLKPLDPIILTSKVSVFLAYYIQKKTMEDLVLQLSKSKKILATENDDLDILANTDALTGLSNRLSFEKALKLTIEFSTKYNEKFALLFLDLDNFKSANDTFGHDCGDFILRETSNRLRIGLRRNDTVNTEDLTLSIFRLGGDEFTVILKNVDDTAHAITVAKRIIKLIDEPFIFHNEKIQIGVTIGIACFPSEGTTVELLIKSADEAMYHAKSKGKNTYYCVNVQ